MALIKKKDRMKVFALLLIAGFGAMQFGLLAPLGINPIDFMAGFGDDVVVDEDIEVYVKITTRLALAHSTTDLAVNMYDEAGDFIDTVTTSSGVGTFSGQYNPGTYVWLQARQAAPADADPYITPLSKWLIPMAGESADTVSLKNADSGDSIMWIRDATASATMVLRNGFNNASITDATEEAFNNTDNAFTAEITCVTANTYYGSESLLDYDNNKREYIGGVFLVWKGTASQPWADAPYEVFSDTTYTWYIWKLSGGLEYDSDGDLTSRIVSIKINLLSGETFATDATIVIDCFDMLNPLMFGTASYFMNGGAADVSAVTTASLVPS